MQQKRTQRNQLIANLIMAAIICAIIIMMIFIPNFGFITIGPISITIIHIPIIVGTILLGKKYGIFFGLIFGIGSLIRAFMSIPTDAPFTNPLVSVVPRVIFGYMIYHIYTSFSKLKLKTWLSVPLTMGFATLIHSLIVLPLLYLVVKTNFYFYPSEWLGNINQGLFVFIWTILITNSLLEIGAAIVIGTPLMLAVMNIQERMQ